MAGAGDLERDFGIGPNALQHARETGKFPEPWMSFGNRNIYLRSDIETYVAERGRAKIEQAVQTVLTSIDALPDGEKDEALRLLNEQLAPPKSRR